MPGGYRCQRAARTGADGGSAAQTSGSRAIYMLTCYAAACVLHDCAALLPGMQGFGSAVGALYCFV